MTNNEQQNNYENLSTSELCDLYVNELRALINKFKENYTDPIQIRFMFFTLKNRVTNLENKLSIELHKRNFNPSTDIENYKKWCKIDDVRGILESAKQFPTPQSVLNSIDATLEN